MKIAILGAGAYGTALGEVLAGRGTDVDFYDPLKERESLSDVLSGAKYAVLCTPSEAAPRVLPHLPEKMPLIVATKGFLNNKYFQRFKDFMVLSGAGYAADIKAQKETHLTATDKRISELFLAEFLKYDYTSDINGVLMCGAMKNVYAMHAGYLDLEPKTKAHTAYLTEVAEEMYALLLSNNAKPQTFDLACGKEDLKLTARLPSRNYEYGQKLRENPCYRPQKTVEGLATLKRIYDGEIIIPDNLKILPEILKIYEKCSIS